MVEFFVARGANVNASDNKGFAPLHLAAQQHQAEIVAFLLERGAAVNPQNVHGNTPLQCAAGRCGAKSVETYRLLLAHGAEPSIKNKFGSSVLYVAAIVESPELRDTLAEFGYQCVAE
jgi:ankyrin repeat protein